MMRTKANRARIDILGTIVLAVFLIVFMTALVGASIEPESAEASSGTVLAEVSADLLSDESAAADGQYDDEPIQSLNFVKDMGVREALSVLAARYNKNIVPSPKVTGQLAFTSLHDVTFEESLDAILGSAFKYELQGNLIKVYTAEEYKKIKSDESRLTHEVFTLYYVTAAEVANLVTPALSKSGVISATSPALLDVEAGQGGDSLAMRDMVTVYDFPENIAKIAGMIAEIDVKSPQILIEVTMLKAKLDETMQFGIDFSNIPGVTMATAGTQGISGNLLNGVITPTTTTGLSFGFKVDDVEGFVQAVENITDTTILANPKIMALNKQAASMIIGDEKGYTTTTVSEGISSQEVEFLEVGTRLSFRPYICKDGNIRMEINPEESSGSVSEGGLPTKATTTIKTNIMVKDGKTIVIGGLFKEETTVSRSQVPVLGDLPFIGSLLKGTKDQSVRTELIILITPHIINDPEDTDGDKRAQDAKILNEGARKGFSWLSRARLSEDSYARAVENYNQGNKAEALSELNYILLSRPDYFEASKLREQILTETDPEAAGKIERIMLDAIEAEHSKRWMRR